LCQWSNSLTRVGLKPAYARWRHRAEDALETVTQKRLKEFSGGWEDIVFVRIDLQLLTCLRASKSLRMRAQIFHIYSHLLWWASAPRSVGISRISLGELPRSTSAPGSIVE
jgi:hypothetical protein